MPKMDKEHEKIYYDIWKNKLTGVLFKRTPSNRIFIKLYECGKSVSPFKRYFGNAIALFKNNETYVFMEGLNENTSISD
jgi:hypothetical protein